jgi:hypothetical protein
MLLYDGIFHVHQSLFDDDFLTAAITCAKQSSKLRKANIPNKASEQQQQPQKPFSSPKDKS